MRKLAQFWHRFRPFCIEKIDLLPRTRQFHQANTRSGPVRVNTQIALAQRLDQIHKKIRRRGVGNDPILVTQNANFGDFALQVGSCTVGGRVIQPPAVSNSLTSCMRGHLAVSPWGFVWSRPWVACLCGQLLLCSLSSRTGAKDGSLTW